MKKTLLLGGLALGLHAHAQNILFQDNFESAINWDMGTGTGENKWLINATYTGSVSASIPNTPAQPGTFTGGPNSTYMHVYSYPNCFGFVPVTCNANFDPNSASDQYTTMSNSISTSLQQSVTLSFWYLCAGEENVSFGTIEYSSDNGSTWTPTGDPLFGVSDWTAYSLTDAAFDNQTNLKFRFRWQNGASGANPPFSVDELTITGTGPGGDTITMQHLNESAYCAGDDDVIGFDATGTYNPGNVFTAQLSDAAGSFATPVNIGTLASTTTGTLSMNVVYPPGTPQGSGYRVRVVSSDPVTTGGDNGADVTFYSLPAIAVTAVPANGEVCEGESVTMTASGASTYSWTPSGTLNSANGATVVATTLQTTVYTVTGADVHGCATPANFTVTIDDCAGLTENAAALFDLYPNPAKDIVHLHFLSDTKISSIELLDQGGRVLATVPATATEIATSQLAPGSYFVRMTHNGGYSIVRFIRQ